MSDVDLDRPLTEAEFQSLEDLASMGFMRRGVVTEHADKLIELGYAVDSPGGLALTESGRRRMERGR